MDPSVRRLAVQVEDHDLAAGDFEGVHPGARRGSGAVIIWDEGDVEIVADEPGHLSFVVFGSKLSGRFGLSHTDGRRWLLVKAVDESSRPGSDVVAASAHEREEWANVAGGRRRGVLTAPPTRLEGAPRPTERCYSMTVAGSGANSRSVRRVAIASASSGWPQTAAW